MYCNCISRCCFVFFFFSSRRRHTRLQGDWSSDVCSSDLVRVEDAHGAPPTIPFWRGEAPSRTIELSAEVAAVRAEIDRRLDADAITWLQSECGLERRGAEQAAAYVAGGRALLGAVPTQETIMAGRV